MADVTGTIHIEHGGKQYALRLSMGGIAKLQAEFGRDIAGLLSGAANEVPDFAAILRVVEVALEKAQPSLSQEKIKDLADDIASTDLVGKIIAAAFPDVEADAGNG
jgi:hypothetical protein